MVKKLWVIIAFLMLACGEDPDFATVTLEESLVFGTREALQSRTGIKSTEAGTTPELQGSFQTWLPDNSVIPISSTQQNSLIDSSKITPSFSTPS